MSWSVRGVMILRERKLNSCLGFRRLFEDVSVSHRIEIAEEKKESVLEVRFEMLAQNISE